MPIPNFHPDDFIYMAPIGVAEITDILRNLNYWVVPSNVERIMHVNRELRTPHLDFMRFHLTREINRLNEEEFNSYTRSINERIAERRIGLRIAIPADLRRS